MVAVNVEAVEVEVEAGEGVSTDRMNLSIPREEMGI